MEKAKVIQNCSLKEYNTFGIEARCRYFFYYTSCAELIDFLSATPELRMPALFLGGGSNILFTSDFEGLVLYSGIKMLEVLDKSDSTVTVRAGAGVVWDDFVQWCVDNGYGGLENLSDIPGTIGASPVQNIGAYGKEAADCIAAVHYVDYFTAEPHTLSKAECGFGYRDSIFKHALGGKAIITSVDFELSLNPEFNLAYGDVNRAVDELGGPSLTNIRQAITTIRRSKLPDIITLGNAGSFFTNPVVQPETYKQLQAIWPDVPMYNSGNLVKVPAGWLIDRCGLRGYEMGRAGVHKHQALVLVNLGDATAVEIVALARFVITTVYEKTGIMLVPEVNIVGSEKIKV